MKVKKENIGKFLYHLLCREHVTSEVLQKSGSKMISVQGSSSHSVLTEEEKGFGLRKEVGL